MAFLNNNDHFGSSSSTGSDPEALDLVSWGLQALLPHHGSSRYTGTKSKQKARALAAADDKGGIDDALSAFLDEYLKVDIEKQHTEAAKFTKDIKDSVKRADSNAVTNVAEGNKYYTLNAVDPDVEVDVEQTAASVYHVLHNISDGPETSLLPFHRYIIRTLIPGAVHTPLPTSKAATASKGKGKEKDSKDDIDASDNALVILARGLGLRRLVATVLKIYDGSHNLVILVNAQPEEEAALAEELTTLGVKRPGLRSVSHEMNAKTRQELYLSGGLLSVTSRILVVDMLNKRIPTHLITGIVVLHAEKVSPTSVEAFIVRIYRQENEEGFLKAFSDDAEHFALGLSPLQTVLRQLQIRKVDLWPRFHQSIVRDLGQRRPDVIELHQPLNRSMLEIQTAIMECLEATLGELKRSSATIEVEDFTVDNAIFRSFDLMVRRQLDPVWHRVGPKTKQLVNDLTTLRSLMNYLLTYDAVTFQSYLETLIASNTTTNSGVLRQNPSPWLGLDAANTIFREAKARVYIGKVDEEEMAKREKRRRRKLERLHRENARRYGDSALQDQGAGSIVRRSGQSSTGTQN
ncbi:hypothetical protein CF319_g1147 [Tilletia indica]|nr:hypothetical protein CF319_g1147 [Tilletia indica]